MRLDDLAASALRVLNKCSVEIRQENPWRWRLMVQNGTRLPLEAWLDESFLQLATHPESAGRSLAELERALMGNAALPGGAGLVLHACGNRLQLRAEIPLPVNTNPQDEFLLRRMKWALDGFHHGFGLLNSLDSQRDRVAPAPSASPHAALAELLRESQWKCEERGPNDFAAALDSDSEPVAKIRVTEHGLSLSVEMGRADEGVSRSALAVFLLTTGSTLRMARAYAVETDGAWGFGFRVCLPPGPEPEEIHHALAALSIAHRSAARETRVLLDQAAARCYLAVRDSQTTN